MNEWFYRFCKFSLVLIKLEYLPFISPFSQQTIEKISRKKTKKTKNCFTKKKKSDEIKFRLTVKNSNNEAKTKRANDIR